MARWDPHRPIRVGILFSQTGIFADAELALLRGAIIGLEALNENGGIDGRPLEPIICDPASDVEQFRALAHQMITEGEIAHIFGCCISTARKAVQPIVERHNALLWYPTQFEGFEFSPNIIYGGACPNQNVLPLAHYLLACGRKRIFLVGSDYIFPRECNRVLRETIERYGGEIVGERYLGTEPNQALVQEILSDRALQRSDAIFSTVVGHANRTLFECYRQAGIDPSATPIASIIISELDIAKYGSAALCGHLAAPSYLESNSNHENQKFIQRLKRRYGSSARASPLSASSYMQVQLFASTVRLTHSCDTEAVTEAIRQVRLLGPHGTIQIDDESHCTYLVPTVARANERGEFDVVRAAHQPIKPDPFLITYM